MTRKFFALGGLLSIVLAGVVFAQDSKTVKLTGYMIDNACASGSHGDMAKTADKAKGHPVSCALMPDCEKSGYAVVADGKMYKFDATGNQSAVELLKSTKSKKGLMVMVEGKMDGETLQVSKLAEVAAAEPSK
ncbi:MAG: hypothetical protein H0W76_06415 [Pyrinomonadaceae bacterium]|nr:hypothetical protein [Pyrinomonadaceae bacterium]